MRQYFAIFKGRFMVLFQYRMALIAGFMTQIFWGFLKTMILTALYGMGAAATSQSINLGEAITFIWIGQIFIHLLPWTIDKESESQIQSGDVLYELIKPIDLYTSWFFRSIALRIAPVLLPCIPFFFMAKLFFGLAAPISWLAAIYFGISLIFATLVSAAITTSVLGILFWTISGDGIKKLLPHVVLFFSGMIVPLPLFPNWVQPLLNILPFRCIVDIPCRIYTGVIPVERAIFYLGFQIFWLVAFIFLGKILINKATKRFVIQGG